MAAVSVLSFPTAVWLFSCGGSTDFDLDDTLTDSWMWLRMITATTWTLSESRVLILRLKKNADLHATDFSIEITIY